MTSNVSINDENILYELLVYSEWFQENDWINRKLATLQQSTSVWSAVSSLNPINLWKKSLLAFDVKSVTDLSWKFASTHDGMFVAILEETLLEIRTVKDDYVSVVGKANVPNDVYPQLRRLVWSPDSTGIALARDNGSINFYNLLGSNLTTIHPANKVDSGVLNPVIGLTFLNTNYKSSNWSSELLVVYFDGTIRSYILSDLDDFASAESINFSLSTHYPKGLTAAVYHPSHHMLIVAGYHCCGKGQNGITAWRILNDHPFLKLSFSSSDCSFGGRSSFFRFIPSYSSDDSILINKMRVSPDGRELVCLHSNGAISFWTLPGMQLKKNWALEEQPEYFAGLPPSDKQGKQYWPIDVDWWSDEAIVLVRKCGAVTVCSTKTMRNILGDSPEMLMGPPQVQAVRWDCAGALILDCEVSVNYRSWSNTLDENGMPTHDSEDEEASLLQASIQAALYSVTDIEKFQPKKKAPKLVQKTYRLLGLKTVTPDELYSRKIANGDYNDALALAETYNLDSDLVYKMQWRMNPVTSFTISEYLGKVRNVVWVAKECTQRKPDEFEITAELLEYGLKVTSANIPRNKSIAELTDEEHELVTCRLKILSYMDALHLYKKILGTHEKYDSVEYDELRKMGPLEATLKFAHEERCEAVRIMLTYRSSVVLPHWLPILSNFPETFRPSQYRFLLPRVLGANVQPWEIEALREQDWSEITFLKYNDIETDDSCLYENDPMLKELSSNDLTVELVENWFIKRAYQMEEYTGLVENALSLIRLGMERGVANLDRLYSDLLTLDVLVMHVKIETASLSTLEKMSHLEQAKLLLSRTNPSTFVIDIKNYLLPFIQRCEEKGCHNKIGLLRDLLLHYCSTSLRMPLELLRHMKEQPKASLSLPDVEMLSLALDCLYSYPEADELENCFAILECLPQRTNNVKYSDIEEKLHNRIDALEKHLEACEIFEMCKCPKSLKFILENIYNEDVAVELMEKVASHARTETLNFTDLLEDLLKLQQIFQCVKVQTCYEICVLAQMTCECEEIIQSADQYLSCWKGDTGKVIPFEESIELILQASRVHFEKSLSFDDPALKLAHSCLTLVSEPHPDICEELDLIEALQLMGDFNIIVLPLQVRIMSNKKPLLERCLNSQKDAYKSCQRLIQLAHALHLDGDVRVTREGEVLILVAQYAFNAEDYSFCSEVCGRLINRNYSPAWEIIQTLGRCDHFLNKDKKKQLLAFAILHCPRECLEELIEYRAQLNENIFGVLARENPVALVSYD